MVTAEQPYQERPSRIAGATLWQVRLRPGETARVLPDGCMDVVYHHGVLLVAGPDTTAKVGPGPQRPAVTTGLRFAPGAGPGVLGVPAAELRDQRVPLDCLWPSATVRCLTERLEDAADPAACLEAAFAENDEPGDPWVRAVVAKARAGQPVSLIAADLDLSERQLHRRGLQLFGYGLKTLTRILRATQAIELARGGTAFGAVAAQTGYADQAHLAREVKALAGVPLGALIR